MTEEIIKYASSNHSDVITAYLYLPNERETRGVIQLSHGMCESVPQYDAFIQAMTKQGYAVCGNDHLGHGETAVTTDKLGWFGEEEGTFHMVQDMKTLSDMARKRIPNVPHHLLGHSMGSFLARLFILWFPKQKDSCILCGTGSGSLLLNTSVGLAKYRAELVGGNKTDPFFAFLTSHKRKGVQMLHRPFLEWANSDKSRIDAYLNNPKRNFLFTSGGFYELFRLFQRANDEVWFESLDKDLPLLLLSGTLDPVGGFGKGIQELYDKLRSAGAKHVSMKLYDSMRHEILQEQKKELVFQDIDRWLRKQENLTLRSPK